MGNKLRALLGLLVGGMRCSRCHHHHVGYWRHGTIMVCEGCGCLFGPSRRLTWRETIRSVVEEFRSPRPPPPQMYDGGAS